MAVPFGVSRMYGNSNLEHSGIRVTQGGQPAGLTGRHDLYYPVRLGPKRL